MVILAMVIERLADTQFTGYVLVIFSLKLRLLIIKLKWTVSCSTSNQLCFRYSGGSYFFAAGLSRFIKSDNIKQVQDIPAFIQLLDFKDCTVRIVRIFKKFKRICFCVASLSSFTETQCSSEKSSQLRSKRIKRDTVVSEVSKGFVHDLIIDSSRKTAQLCAGQLFTVSINSAMKSLLSAIFAALKSTTD